MNEIGQDVVKGIAEANKVRSRESDYIGKRGYRRRYRDPKDESKGYDWRYRFTPNDGNGKLTREAEEVGELNRPHALATLERQARAPRTPKAALRDKRGEVRMVDPGIAEETARERGWSHAWRAGGVRVDAGINGELWREYPDGTREPTGRWCLTEPQPWVTVPEGGNPDGTMRAE